MTEWLGHVASTTAARGVLIRPWEAMERIAIGDDLEFSSVSGHARCGYATVVGIDARAGCVEFAAYLNTMVPAVIEGDLVRRYVRPCTRCRCAACDIQIAQTPDSSHTPNARGMPNDVETLEAAVKKMRALGVTKWNGIELGPEPALPSDDEDEPSGNATDPATRRAERQRVASLASGGPVPAGGRSQQPTR